jgi:hypothetical protein
MNLRHTTSSLAALLLAACASAPPEQQSAEAKPQQVCERVYKVGVAIPVKECTTAPLSEDERRRMQDELRNTVRPGASKPPG